MFPYIDRKWRYWLTWMKNHSLGSQASMIVVCYFQMQGPRPQGSNTLERRWGSLSVLWEFTERVFHWAFKECSLSGFFWPIFFFWTVFFFSVCALWVFPERSLSFLWVISNLPLSDLLVISEWYLKVPSVCPELPWVLIWSEYCDTGVGLSDNLKSGLLALWSCFIACEECSLAPWLIMGQDVTDYIWDDNILLV